MESGLLAACSIVKWKSHFNFKGLVQECASGNIFVSDNLPFEVTGVDDILCEHSLSTIAGLPHAVGPMNNIGLALVGATPTGTFDALVPELYNWYRGTNRADGI